MKQLLIAISLILLGALILALSQARWASADPTEASWYGDEAAGQRTASGEIFDPNAYTAAHPFLPFGTRLLVKHEGRGVVVRVSDRGPFVGSRQLDLSKAAAQSIGLTDEGVAPVEVEQVESPAPAVGAPELPKTGGM